MSTIFAQGILTAGIALLSLLALIVLRKIGALQWETEELLFYALPILIGAAATLLSVPLTRAVPRRRKISALLSDAAKADENHLSQVARDVSAVLADHPLGSLKTMCRSDQFAAMLKEWNEWKGLETRRFWIHHILIGGKEPLSGPLNVFDLTCVVLPRFGPEQCCAILAKAREHLRPNSHALCITDEQLLREAPIAQSKVLSDGIHERYSDRWGEGFSQEYRKKPLFVHQSPPLPPWVSDALQEPKTLEAMKSVTWASREVVGMGSPPNHTVCSSLLDFKDGKLMVIVAAKSNRRDIVAGEHTPVVFEVGGALRWTSLWPASEKPEPSSETENHWHLHKLIKEPCIIHGHPPSIIVHCRNRGGQSPGLAVLPPTDPPLEYGTKELAAKLADRMKGDALRACLWLEHPGLWIGCKDMADGVNRLKQIAELVV